MNLVIDNITIHISHNPETFDPSKTTIIFLHDSLGCTSLWRDFPKKVQSLLNCNIMSYDRQEYGKSSPFTILKRNNNYLKNEAIFLGLLLKQLKLKKVILFGHSDGGSIALLAAALYPEKIKAIITEGAHVFVEKETIKGIKEAQKMYRTTSLREKLMKYHGDKTEMVFKMWVETWLSEAYQTWNIENYLPEIQCPSLIIQGEKDEYGTLEQVQAIINQTKGKSQSLIIPDIGHTPHKEEPNVVLKILQKFVNSL